MAKEFLPIGSVVQLANSTALVMVSGYLPVVPERPGYVWDYAGFKFPIGYTDGDSVYCFDHGQIETVYAHGYKDIEEEIFMSKLMEIQDQVSEEAKQRAAGAGTGNDSEEE